MTAAGTGTDLVTGAFSYSGSRIAELLLESGREVKTLTHHPDREHPLQRRVQASPYRFDDPLALERSLEGVTTLYNTYWIRFEQGSTTFADAVAQSRALFQAARRAGVARIVQVSIANPSVDSPLPYYRGKARVEQALTAAGVPYSIVRPTWIFGGEREVLANNIAWILRRMPIFVVPGDGRYPVQPVHVDDFCADLCARGARSERCDHRCGRPRQDGFRGSRSIDWTHPWEGSAYRARVARRDGSTVACAGFACTRRSSHR